MNDSTRLIVFGIAMPAVLGLVVGVMGAAGARHQSAGGAAPRVRVVGEVVVGLVLAVLAGALMLVTWGVHGAASFPPVSSDDRLRLVPGVVLAAAVFGLIVRVAMGPGPARAAIPRERLIGALTALLAAGAGAAVANGTSSLSRERLLAVPATAALAYAGCFALLSFQERREHVRGGVVLVGLALAIGAALTGTGSLVLGQYGFGAAAVAGGVVLGGLALRGPTRPFTLAMLSAFFAVLVCCGVVFSSTPLWVAALLGCVAPVALVVSVVASRRLRPAAAGAVVIAAAAVVAAIAVAPGVKSLADFMMGSGGSTYGE